MADTVQLQSLEQEDKFQIPGDPTIYVWVINSDHVVIVRPANSPPGENHRPISGMTQVVYIPG
jgi:hypothetical protein